MSRLTEKGFDFTSDFVASHLQSWPIAEALKKLAAYEDALTLEEAQEYAKARDEGNVVLPETGIGDMSDGFHTFNELYHHRAVLFSVICNARPEIAWKSKLHHDGTMYDGMFIVGLQTPYGQATYHYDIEPYWAYFCVPILKNAPEWDGHTPIDAINRLLFMGTPGAEAALQKEAEGVE